MTFQITKNGGFNKQCLEKTAKRRKINLSLVDVKKAASNGLPNDLLPAIEISWHHPDDLTVAKRRIRKPNIKQVGRVIAQIKAFTFLTPIMVRKKVVVDGHIRLLAARELGLEKVPCIDVGHLSEADARMLAISLNRLGETGSGTCRS